MMVVALRRKLQPRHNVDQNQRVSAQLIPADCWSFSLLSTLTDCIVCLTLSTERQSTVKKKKKKRVDGVIVLEKRGFHYTPAFYPRRNTFFFLSPSPPHSPPVHTVCERETLAKMVQ
jgi:hypothetical protein